MRNLRLGNLLSMSFEFFLLLSSHLLFLCIMAVLGALKQGSLKLVVNCILIKLFFDDSRTLLNARCWYLLKPRTCRLKVSKSRKQFLEFSILPKNERKMEENILRAYRIIFFILGLFFERIVNSKSCFRDLLTFSTYK